MSALRVASITSVLLLLAMTFTVPVVHAKKRSCAAGKRWTVVKTAEGSTEGCSDGKKFFGTALVRGQNSIKMMAGDFVDGEMHGRWTLFLPSGRVKSHPLFEHGKLVAEDSPPVAVPAWSRWAELIVRDQVKVALQALRDTGAKCESRVDGTNTRVACAPCTSLGTGCVKAEVIIDASVSDDYVADGAATLLFDAPISAVKGMLSPDAQDPSAASAGTPKGKSFSMCNEATNACLTISASVADPSLVLVSIGRSE